MLLIENIGTLVGYDESSATLSLMHKVELLVEQDRIAWIGSADERPVAEIDDRIDALGKVVMPGLIDCHSHLIFAGSRAHEFGLRMQGLSYQEIMAEGGGIMATVTKTRAASDEELLRLAHMRANRMLGRGVTTVEAKSGYGLSCEHELRILRLLKKLDTTHAIDIHSTFLGAHVVPAEQKANRQAYVDEIIYEMLPRVADENLAHDCDIFCEQGAFSIAETRAIMTQALDLGLGLRAHLLQLSHQDSVCLLDEFPIKSISHAEYLSNADIAKLKHHNVVVELLPIAALFLRAQIMPPVKQLQSSLVKMAIATDFNPGSAMCDDLILAARLAVTLWGIAPHDALLGITTHAALSLGCSDRGMLISGKKADILITSCEDINELFYDWTMHPARITIKNGRPVRNVHEESSFASP